jgi:hypothetical protein
MLRVREHAPTIFFFHYFALGPTFKSLKEFGGASFCLDKLQTLLIVLGFLSTKAWDSVVFLSLLGDVAKFTLYFTKI